MKRTLLVLWLITSALLVLLAIALAYMSLMMGAVHWDWWLSCSLGGGFVVLAGGGFWMCRRAFRLLRNADG